MKGLASALCPYAWGPSDDSLDAFIRSHDLSRTTFFLPAAHLLEQPELLARDDHERLLRLLNRQEEYVAGRTGYRMTWDTAKMEQSVDTFDQLMQCRRGQSTHELHSLTAVRQCPAYRYYLPCVMMNDGWSVPQDLDEYPQMFAMVGDALRQTYKAHTGPTVRWADLTTYTTALKAGASDVLTPENPIKTSECTHLNDQGTMGFKSARMACQWYFKQCRDPWGKYRQIIASCVDPSNAYKRGASPEVHEFYKRYPMFMSGRCAFDFDKLVQFETAMYELFMGTRYSVVPVSIRDLLI